jgi:hypothetical protein
MEKFYYLQIFWILSLAYEMIVHYTIACPNGDSVAHLVDIKCNIILMSFTITTVLIPFKFGLCLIVH